MKKIILILLSLSAVVLFACDKVKYEFIDGFLYANGKEATGTFEFKLNGYKTKAKYVNGLANGLFERYYPDGSILIKNEVKDGIVSKIEVYYKSGETLAIIADSKYMKIFNKDGSLVESYDADKNETILYQEDENPFILSTGVDTTTYNKNNKILPKVENGKEVGSNIITKNLGNGLSEVIMDDKVIAKFDDNIGSLISFYSTGKPMYIANATTSETQIFSKNQNILYKSKGTDFTVYNKDGEPIHELRGGVLIFYNEDGDEILMNSYEVEDIKKID